MPDMVAGPTPVDLAFQVAFKMAHRLLRLYWTITKPHKGGILIGIWNGGEVLIVKNTYRRQHTLPGGYPRAGETPAQTGVRELAEECDVEVRSEDLREVYRAEHLFEGRRDDVTIVEVQLPTRPSIHVDNREIAYARFARPEEILGLEIVPHLREYLEKKAAQSRPAPAGPAA
jgi:8-oxo-dGTP diphosphatase